MLLHGEQKRGKENHRRGRNVRNMAVALGITIHKKGNLYELEVSKREREREQRNIKKVVNT